MQTRQSPLKDHHHTKNNMSILSYTPLLTIFFNKSYLIHYFQLWSAIVVSSGMFRKCFPRDEPIYRAIKRTRGGFRTAPLNRFCNRALTTPFSLPSIHWRQSISKLRKGTRFARIVPTGINRGGGRGRPGSCQNLV